MFMRPLSYEGLILTIYEDSCYYQDDRRCQIKTQNNKDKLEASHSFLIALFCQRYTWQKYLKYVYRLNGRSTFRSTNPWQLLRVISSFVK